MFKHFVQKGSVNSKHQDSCAVCTWHKAAEPGKECQVQAQATLAKARALALACVHVEEEVPFPSHKGMVCLLSHVPIGLRMSTGGTHRCPHEGSAQASGSPE